MTATTNSKRRNRARFREVGCQAVSDGEAATRRWFPNEADFEKLVDGVIHRVEELRNEGQRAVPEHKTQLALFPDVPPWTPLNVTRRAKEFSDLRGLVSRAFLSLSRGLPEDHVVIDPEANVEFIARCRLLGATVSEYALNKALLNARKAGWHAGVDRGSTEQLSRETMDRIGFAAEIAARLVQLLSVEVGAPLPSVDRMLCDPELRRTFDDGTRVLAPGFAAYQYRLAALAYRKSGRQSSHRLSLAAPPDWQQSNAPLLTLDPGDAPETPGLYRVDAGTRAVFISATLNLRNRLLAHIRAGEGQGLVPPSLYELPARKLTVRWFEAPAEWKPRRTDAVAWRMKSETKAMFNLFERVA